MVWWESNIQDDLAKKGKNISSWYDFIVALKKQFYPLGYIQQAIMDWKHLKKGKGQSVQEFTYVFKKKALALDISLNTRETLLKYIGRLYSYLRHTFLMFEPTAFD